MSLLEEIISTLEAAGIRHALIGALALSVYGVNRASVDLDLFAADPSCLRPDLWAGLQFPTTFVDLPPSGRQDVLTPGQLGAIMECMETTKRATIYFDPEIHRALRLKAAATERSVSELVNEAVGLALGEDAEDLEIFEQRRGGPLLSFDEVIKSLKRCGRI